MQNSKSELANIFRAFAQVLGEMDDEDYYGLIRGEGRLTYVSYGRTNKQRGEKAEIVRGIEHIATELVSFETREEAEKFLTIINITKSDLVKLSALLQIYINKSDSKEKIIEKIVESTVGAQIRSKAIKETNISRLTKHESRDSLSREITTNHDKLLEEKMSDYKKSPFINKDDRTDS
jgi:hypothetical protein